MIGGIRIGSNAEEKRELMETLETMMIVKCRVKGQCLTPSTPIALSTDVSSTMTRPGTHTPAHQAHASTFVDPHAWFEYPKALRQLAEMV